jgi:hypothetical protein
MKSLSPNDNHIACRNMLGFHITCWINIFMEGIPFLFAIKQSTFVQSNTTQVYFKQLNCLPMYATCFDMYLHHPQACKYKEHIQEDTTKIQGSLDFYYIFCICSLYLLPRGWCKYRPKRVAYIGGQFNYCYYLFLTAIGLTPGGSSTVHIYTQTVHRIQRTEHT